MRDHPGTAASPPASPTRPWAVRLDRANLSSVGRLRRIAGVEVCTTPDQVWLRGPSLDDKLQHRLAALPGAERFNVLPDGQLQPVASRLPKNRLPGGPWAPLSEWLEIQLPPARLAGRLAERTPMVLVRSHCAGTANVLLTSMDCWLACAIHASQVRLDRWQFAAAADGRVVVRGEPLPSLSGQRWVAREGIAAPAGWRWSPPLEPAIVRTAFGLKPGDLALWQTDGTWQRIRAEDFTAASRAAVRATAEGFRHAAH